MYNNIEILKFKTLIYVPYEKKEDAKKNGAFFDTDLKSWYIPNGDNNKNYKYLIDNYGKPFEKIYLNVPYAEKDYVKEKFAMYDKDKKAWFIYDHNPEKKLLLKLFGDGIEKNNKNKKV